MTHGSNPFLEKRRIRSIQIVCEFRKMGVTFLDSSSALCFAVLETDLSDSNRARRNSILIEGESSMTGVFLMKHFHDFRLE